MLWRASALLALYTHAARMQEAYVTQVNAGDVIHIGIFAGNSNPTFDIVLISRCQGVVALTLCLLLYRWLWLAHVWLTISLCCG